MASPAERLHRINYEQLGPVGDFLLSCRDDGLTPLTVLTMLARLKAAREAIGKDLLDADEEDARRWWRHLAVRQLENATRAVYLSAMRSFYGWAVMNRLIDADPTRRIKTPKHRRGAPRDVDPRMVVPVVKNLPRRHRSMIGLALWSGLRCLEIAQVLPSRDLVTRTDGSRTLRVHGKGEHRRVISVPAHLAVDLEDCPLWAFPSQHEPSTHITAAWVSVLGSRLMSEAGLPAVTMHQLRHTFATALYQRTRDLTLVANQLGHSCVSSAQIYARAAALDPGIIEALFE
jgi:site-specific recombinase XerD